MLTKNIKELKKQYKLTVLQLQYVQRAKLIINLGFSAREWAIFEIFTKETRNVSYNLATKSFLTILTKIWNENKDKSRLQDVSL